MLGGGAWVALLPVKWAPLQALSRPCCLKWLRLCSQELWGHSRACTAQGGVAWSEKGGQCLWMGRAGKGPGGSPGGGDGGPGWGMVVTIACVGGESRKARFQAQAFKSGLSGWADGPSTVIWVRPGLEGKGPDRPKLRAPRLKAWGRWRLKGVSASQWGGQRQAGLRGEPGPTSRGRSERKEPAAGEGRAKAPSEPRWRASRAQLGWASSTRLAGWTARTRIARVIALRPSSRARPAVRTRPPRPRGPGAPQGPSGGTDAAGYSCA